MWCGKVHHHTKQSVAVACRVWYWAVRLRGSAGYRVGVGWVCSVFRASCVLSCTGTLLRLSRGRRRPRGASAWWCGTGVGSGPRPGRPGEAMAPSDFARFLASVPAPAQWLPGSGGTQPHIEKQFSDAKETGFLQTVKDSGPSQSGVTLDLDCSCVEKSHMAAASNP